MFIVYFQMSKQNLCTSLNQQYAKNLLNNHDTFLFDCDGVLWNLPDTFPRAIELLNYLKEKVCSSIDSHLRITSFDIFRVNVSSL